MSCWGRNANGEATAPAGTDYVTVDAGGYHNCAIKADGSLVCWDLDSDYGQSTPPAGADYVTLSLGERHSCASHFDGTIECWGSDVYGQCTLP